MTTILPQLDAWLEQPTYDVGVLLYQRWIGEDFWFRMFSKGADDYNREQLRAALEKKHAELLEADKAMKAAYPDPLKESLQTGGLLMDERTILKERMRLLYNSGVPDSLALKEMAFRILSIKDELDGIYGRKNFFEQHGFLPELATVTDAPYTPADLLKRRNSVRTYVTRYAKEVAETVDPVRLKKITAKLEAFQTELSDLDNQLTQLNHGC